jgi:TRAP-type C4-dicarboxylate transport system substrate-binding protein
MNRLVALALTGLLAVGVTSHKAAAETWDMPTPYPDGNFHTKTVAAFAADVAKATNGKIEIAIHSAGSLYKHAEIKNAVRKGLAPIGEVLISLHSNESPVYGFDSVPFLATGYGDARKLYDAQKAALEETLEKDGLVLLYSVPWPPQGLYAKREINSVGDLAGLKFRTYNAIIGRLAALAKAAPVQIEIPDLPTAFATGRVDVMITSASSGVQSKAEEYLTHYYDTQAWLPRNMVFVNKAAFDKLSADEQKALRAAAATAEAKGWEASEAEMAIKTKMLKDAGIIVQPPSPELLAGLKEIGKTLADEWKEKAGEQGAAMVDAFLSK